MGEIATLYPYNELAKTRLMLESQPDCKSVLQIINDTVTSIINADRTALFLVDSEGKNLYAQVFTVSEEDEQLVTLDHLETTSFENYLNQLGRKLNVVCYKGSNVAYDKLSPIACMALGFILVSLIFRVSIDKGVVGHTARTGKLQNVTDARSYPYFCAEVDEMTGYTTKNLLCAPLVAQGRYVKVHDTVQFFNALAITRYLDFNLNRILGVLEAVNKKDGAFTAADEQILQSLGEFCGLLVTSCRMKEDFILIDNRLKVLVTQYHAHYIGFEF